LIGVGAQGVIVEDLIVHVLPALKFLSRIVSLTVSGWGSATLGVVRDVCKRLPASLQSLTITDLPTSQPHRLAVVHAMPKLQQLNGSDITDSERFNAASMFGRLFQACSNAAVTPSVGVGLGSFPSSHPVLIGCEVTANPSLATVPASDADTLLQPSPKKGSKSRKATNGGGVVITQPSFSKVKLSSLTDNVWLTGLQFPAAFNCVDAAVRAANVTVGKLAAVEACWLDVWTAVCDAAVKKMGPYVDSTRMLDLEDEIVRLGRGK
jgi:hypothetical protein